MPDSSAIFTIGHSNQSIESFIAALQEHAIRVVIDVRSSPYSRFAPHFSKRPLEQALARTGIRYVYLGDRLGGLPESGEFYDPDGYVLYGKIAATAPFRQALQQLIEMSADYRVTLMCAEENPAGCHRRLLVARALRDRGVRVRHIRGNGAVIDDADLPADQPSAALQPSLFESPEPVWRSLRPVKRREKTATSPFDPPH